MTHQAFLLKGFKPYRAPYRTFFQRFGFLGTCVLPAEVLDDTTLPDPETGQQSCLRQRCSQDGLCYAWVLYAIGEGLYWADVAATPDLIAAERIVLTEAHLVYALAWDQRLFWRTPSQIRHLMQAQAEEFAPLHPLTPPELPIAPFPTPLEPLTVVTTVEVTPDELREAFESTQANHTSDAPTSSGPRQPGICFVQQRLLRVLSRALQDLLETVSDRYTAQVLQALSALVARVTRWQQQTRQRVVNAVRSWDAESRGLAWALTLGVPEALLDVA